MKAQESIKTPKGRRSDSLSNRQGWMSLRAAWLLAFAVAVAFFILERNLSDTNLPRFNFSMVFFYSSFVVAGMMLGQLVRPSKKVASIAGAVGCAEAVAYIIYLGITIYLRTDGFLRSYVMLALFTHIRKYLLRNIHSEQIGKRGLQGTDSAYCHHHSGCGVHFMRHRDILFRHKLSMDGEILHFRHLLYPGSVIFCPANRIGCSVQKQSGLQSDKACIV